MKIGREIEGGAKEIDAIDLPCVLSIQTGINEPRYVGMRGIRQVASVPIPTLGAAELNLEPDAVGAAAAKVQRLNYFVPAGGPRRGDVAGQPRRGRREADGAAESQRRVELMPRIFAFIVHKAGVADDTALELAAAARKLDAAQSPTAIVTGWGADLDAVCESLRASYAEVWKVAKEPLAYPNAELVRKALVNILPREQRRACAARPLWKRPLARALDPAGCGVSARRSGHRRRRRPVAQGRAPGVWRPGEHARPLRHVLGRRAEHSARRVSARSESAPANGQVVDKSAEAGTLTSRAAVSGDHRGGNGRCRYQPGGGAGFSRTRHSGAGECRDRRGSRGGAGRRR